MWPLSRIKFIWSDHFVRKSQKNVTCRIIGSWKAKSNSTLNCYFFSFKLPWSGKVHSNSPGSFAPRAQLAWGCQIERSEIRETPRTSSSLRAKHDHYILRYSGFKHEWVLWMNKLVLPSIPWPKSNLEIPSIIKHGLATLGIFCSRISKNWRNFSFSWCK